MGLVAGFVFCGCCLWNFVLLCFGGCLSFGFLQVAVFGFVVVLVSVCLLVVCFAGGLVFI